MQDFLASSEDMTKFIATVSDAADQAREANNGTKDIALSFDEWGVWYSDKWNEQEDQWKAEAAQVCTTSHGPSLHICWKTSTPRPTRWSKVP